MGIVSCTQVVNGPWWAVMFVVAACVPLRATEVTWVGGVDSSWQTPLNWGPIEVGDPPQVVHRVPEDGDDVVIGAGTNGAIVQLGADSAAISSLMLLGGIELITAGHLLQVGDGTSGVTTVNGDGTTLGLESRVLPPNDRVPALATYDLQVGGGSTVELRDAVLHVDHQMVIESGGTLSGHGKHATLDLASTGQNAARLVNDGTIRPFFTVHDDRFSRMTLSAQGGAVLDLDGETEDGIIDIEGPNPAELSVAGPLADPFSGNLSIGASNGFEAFSSSFAFEDATIEIVGADLAPAPSTFLGGSDITIDGNSLVTIDSGRTSIDGSFRMFGGEFIASGDVFMLCQDSYSGIGACAREFGPNTRFFLEDGSGLDLADYSNTVDVIIHSHEVDLDGIDGDVEIEIGLFSTLLVETQLVDNDSSSPGFDGTFRIPGGELTMNINGGWELDGRLELGAHSHIGSAQLFGTTMTVDGGEPGDGVFVAGRDIDNPEEITIHTDVVLTENARVGITEELGYLKITSSLEANGTLEYIKLFEDYDPPVGTVHRIIDAEGGLTGRFTVLDFFRLPRDRGWLVEYGSNSVDLRVVPTQPGDFNGDGVVDQGDLDLVLFNWGAVAAPPVGWVNDSPSGIVDQADLDRVLLNWGGQGVRPATAPAAGTVPELATWLLGVLAALVHWCRTGFQPVSVRWSHCWH